MATGIVSTANMQGVATPPASVGIPQVKPGEVLFTCSTKGMRVVFQDGQSKFFIGGYMVLSDPAEIAFMRTVSRATEVKDVKKIGGQGTVVGTVAAKTP